METCAYLGCPDNTPAEIAVGVFAPGGSYPLWVCSDEHLAGLQAAAPEGIDVVRLRGE